MPTQSTLQPLATRTLVRGTQATFDVLFVEPDGSPIVPVDPGLYPAVSITDSEGTVVDTGVAVSLGDGRWQYSFLISADAVLSTDEYPWRIDWLMLTASGNQVQLGQNFGVTDSWALEPTDRAYTQLVLLGQPARIMVKFKQSQADVKLVLTDASGCSVDMTGSINSTTYNNWYVYYVDTPAWTTPGQYTAIWTASPNILTPPQSVVSTIRVPDPVFWQFQPSIRMLIDKVQKKSGHVQAYSDSDIYEYLLRGLELVNAAGPIVTHWSLPIAAGFGPIPTFIIAAAAMWGLQAQYIAEGDLAFNFSGQTVTLDVDRTGYYDAAINRLNDFLNNQLPTTKKGLTRQMSAGTVGVRPISFRHGPYMARWSNTSATGGPGIFPIGRLGVLV